MKPVKNLQGAEEGDARVIRGGSWLNSAWSCRAANRDHWRPGETNDILGFRLIMVARRKKP